MKKRIILVLGLCLLVAFLACSQPFADNTEQFVALSPLGNVENPVNFTWTPKEGAIAYRIQYLLIIDRAGGNNPVFPFKFSKLKELSDQTLSWNFPDNFPAGKGRWTLEALVDGAWLAPENLIMINNPTSSFEFQVVNKES